MNRKVVETLALAQRASDSGKWKSLKSFERTRSKKLGKLLGRKAELRAAHHNYHLKDSLMVQAIELIRCDKDSGFRYFVVECYDFKAPCWIVYFDCKVDGVRYQCSFHTFNKEVARYVKGSSASRGRWRKTSSREVCISLMSLIKE